MSNCIHIDTPRLVLSYSQVDASGLHDLVNRVIDLPDAPDWQSDPDGNCAWWFLSTNVEFTPKGVTITFGQGRSSHTNRDFRYTLMILSKFMMQSVKVRFTTRDEYDNFEAKNYEVVDLLHPTWTGMCI